MPLITLYDANNLYLQTKVEANNTGVARTFSYNFDFAIGVMTSKTDVNNNVKTTYDYDLLGRLTNVTEDSTGLKRQTNTTYDDANRRVTVQRDQYNSGDKALVSVTNYDQMGRVALTQQLENSGQSPTDPTVGIKVQTRYIYSGGNSYKLVSNPYREATSSAAGSACNQNYAQCTMGWIVTRYDQDGRIVSEQFFDGSGLPAPWGSNGNSSGAVSTAYNGNQTMVTDQAGNVRQNQVDALGRLVGVVEDPGSSPHLNYGTTYGYDALDNLAGVNQTGRTRSFVYDSLKRLSSAMNPESGTVSYTYDSAGNLVSRKDNRLITTSYSYDALNRITGKTYSDGTPGVTYSYDAANVANAKGRLTSLSNSNATTNYTSFDALGNVLSSNQMVAGQTYSFTYTYNLSGSLKTETYPSGRTITTGYDAAGYDTADRPYTTTGTLGGQQTSYNTQTNYWPHGAISNYWYGNNVVPAYTYNNRLQPGKNWATLGKVGTTDQSPNDHNQYLLILIYGWGNNGNLQGAGEGYGSAVPYNSLSWVWQGYLYDTVNRLKSVSDSGYSRNFGYDAWGNMWIAGWTGIAPVGNPPTTSTGFNANNQVTTGGASYDLAGNQTAMNGNTVAYDAENRQSSVTDGVTHAIETYQYDGDGKRVEKTGPSVATVYVYEALGQLAAEYSTATNTPACKTCYLVGDNLGSTRLVTDQNAAIVSRHDYLPFGEELGGSAVRTGPWGSTTDVTQKFTGQERDQETGLDFFGARYYGSALGRFTSPDKPLIGQDEHDPQSWNLYSYVRNNPLRYTDPDGENYFVCVSNGNGGAKCQTYSDDDYMKLYGQQNGKQGINLPGQFQSGDITCGGTACGSSYYYSTGDAQDESFGIGLGVGVGKAVGAVAARALGFVAGLFGRTATTAAVEAGADVLAGKVLTGFSAAEEQMIQKSLSALEAAGYNTGRLQTFIRIADAPTGYAGMSLGDGAALADDAFSSQAMLNHTIEHELIHMEQTAQGLRTAYGPGTAQSLEEGADSQAKFPAPNH